MSIESIGSAATGVAEPAIALSSAQAPSFGERLASEFQSVNAKLVTAEHGLRELAAGGQSNLHHVMLALEDARLSFQLLVQVRNKVLDAYQELLRMQV